ncbi:MAG: hypothetical protein WA828_03605 [Coleofasciculaceae cyanobacterium]
MNWQCDIRDRQQPQFTDFHTGNAATLVIKATKKAKNFPSDT